MRAACSTTQQRRDRSCGCIDVSASIQVARQPRMRNILRDIYGMALDVHTEVSAPHRVSAVYQSSFASSRSKTRRIR